MPNLKYFKSIKNFTEPIGNQFIKKDSKFLYLKDFDAEDYEVLFFDKSEGSVYPFIAPIKALKQIDRKLIPEKLQRLFELKKSEIDNHIYHHEYTLDTFE